MRSSAPEPGTVWYRRPDPAIVEVLNAPPPPAIAVSPARDCLLLVQGERYPPIAAVAAPVLRLAGLRIDPRTNGPHLPTRVVGLTLVSIPGGEHRQIVLPS